MKLTRRGLFKAFAGVVLAPAADKIVKTLPRTGIVVGAAEAPRVYHITQEMIDDSIFDILAMVRAEIKHNFDVRIMKDIMHEQETVYAY